jgi:hypothetical protein
LKKSRFFFHQLTSLRADISLKMLIQQVDATDAIDAADATMACRVAVSTTDKLNGKYRVAVLSRPLG